MIDDEDTNSQDEASIWDEETTSLDVAESAEVDAVAESDATIEQSSVESVPVDGDDGADTPVPAAAGDPPEDTDTVAPGRSYAIATLVVAAIAAFAIGAALGKGFAPSASDAALARIDARDAAREQAYTDAYETAHDTAFAAEKKRGAVAGTRQGTIEGKRTGKAAAAKKAPAATAASAAPADCPSFDLDGVDYGGGAGYFDISVRGMQCQEAKNLILAAGFGGNLTGLQANGWSCQSLGSEGETSQFRCSDSRDRVFRWWSGA